PPRPPPPASPSQHPLLYPRPPRRITHTLLLGVGGFSRSRRSTGLPSIRGPATTRGSTMRKLGDQAGVLGASMAGLLAARVLSDAYQRVTVVERDVLSTRPENRRGVPQGRHAHWGVRGSPPLRRTS